MATWENKGQVQVDEERARPVTSRRTPSGQVVRTTRPIWVPPSILLKHTAKTDRILPRGLTPTFRMQNSFKDELAEDLKACKDVDIDLLPSHAAGKNQNNCSSTEQTNSSEHQYVASSTVHLDSKQGDKKGTDERQHEIDLKKTKETKKVRYSLDDLAEALMNGQIQEFKPAAKWKVYGNDVVGI